jgi:tol-pal system protein YbgF
MGKLKLLILLSPVMSIAAEKSVSEIDNVSQPSSADTASFSDQPGSVSGRGDLYYQLQVLQAELRDLRGELEEQKYLLRTLERDHQDRYVELDKRLSSLNEDPLAQFSQTGDPSPRAGFVKDSPSLSKGSERDEYGIAIDLMRARKFQEAISSFQALIETFPNGRYTANCFYWLGELFVATGEKELGRQNFMQVINLYPDNQKVPDALYKLGRIYIDLGDMDIGRRYLRRVMENHPESSAAKLAITYSESLTE